MLSFDHHPTKAEDEDFFAIAKSYGARCDVCPLRHERAGPVLHQVNQSVTAPLVVVGEAPGPNEVDEGQPFVGKSGRILDQELERGGLARHQASVLNVQACMPPRKLDEYEEVLKARARRDQTEAELVLPRHACAPYFSRAYYQATRQSNVTLALGAFAQRAVEQEEGLTQLPLSKTWGGPRQLKPTKEKELELAPEQHDERTRWLISAYHPARAMREPKWMNVTKDIIARASRIAARQGRLDWSEPEWLPSHLGSILFWLNRWRTHGTPLIADIEAPKGGPIVGAREGIYCISIGDFGENILLIPIRRLGGGPCWPPDQMQLIARELQRVFEVCPLTLQFGQYDTEVLAQLNLRHRESLWADTLHMHKATNENDLPHGLGALTRRLFDCPIYKVDPEGKDTATEAKSDHELGERCNRDVLTTLRAAKRLAPQVIRFKTEAQYDTDIHMAQVCRDMGELGIPVKLDQLQELVDHYTRAASDAKHEFKEQAKLPEQFNPNSSHQLQQLVFKEWGYLPTLVKSDQSEFDEERHDEDEASTSRQALVALIDRGVDPRHEQSLWSLLTYKQVEKTRQVITNLTIEPHPHAPWARLGFGLARPTWRSDVIPTGRLVAREFPMQLLQKRAFGGKNVLRIFEAPPGYKFVGGDWHQVELRLYAIFANDRELLRIFAAGLDAHCSNAASLIGRGAPVEDVYRRLKEGPKDEHDHFRQYAKIHGFREIYGGSDTRGIFHGMRAELNKVTGERLFPDLTQEDVDEGHESWHKLHPETRQHQKDAVAEWRRTGCVRSPILDRRARYFFEEDVNAITNMRIQGSAAALANRQTLLIRQWLGHRGQGGQTRGLAGEHSGICVQIHDDQRMLVREEVAEVAAQIADEAGRFQYTNQAGATMDFSCEIEITDHL